MQDHYSLTHPLMMFALAYIGKDVMPWVGVQLVACGKWAAPQMEKIVDALVSRLSQPKSVQAGKSPDTISSQAEPKKDNAPAAAA